MTRVRVALALAGGLAAGIVASCTIFDGLESRVDGGPGDGGQSDVLATGTQPGFLSLADGVSFCSNVFACTNLATSTEFSVDVPVDVNRFSSCVDWVSGPLPKDRIGVSATAALLQCAAQAKDCQSAGACMWYDVIDPGDPRCAGKDAGPTGECGDDGGAVYFCGQGLGIVHCGSAHFTPGSSCLYDDAGVPWCVTLPCTNQQCIGDMLSYCGTDGLQYSQNCAMSGLSCGFDSKENYDDCLTNGVATKCTALAVSCSGATVTLCDSILQVNYDCAAYGGTCDQTGFPRCKRPNETCTPEDADIDVCTGNTIALCVGGQKTSFDCSSIGKTCVAGQSGQSSHCQ